MRVRAVMLCAVLCTAVTTGRAGAQESNPTEASSPSGEAPTPTPTPTPTPAPAPTQAPAPAPTPTPAPAPTPTQAGAACTPACRAGYTCHHGTCISACNPPCATGERCTADATCASAAAAGAGAEGEISESELNAELRRREQEKKAKVQQWREAHRYDHHLTLDGSLRGAVLSVRGSDDDSNGDVAASGYGVLSVGYMHNFVRNFGLRVRFSVGFGGVGLGSVRDFDTATEYTDEDGAFATLVELEVLPYAGTFGPFYVGPLAFVDYRGYDKGALVTEQGGRTLRRYELDNNVVAGTGLGMGTVLGSRQDLHLSWSFRTTFTSTLPFEVGVGFGYRFGRLWSKAED